MIYLIDLLFVILFTGISYIACDELIVPIIVCLASLIYFLTIFNNKFNRYQYKIIRYHECFNFVNTFITSLSATNSIVQAFERTTLRVSVSLNKELKGIENLDVIEKIHYLKKYFPFHVYELFLNILDLFIEQGGDILVMSNYLIKEVRLIEEYIDACKTAALKRVIEIVILWVMSLGLLVFIRFGLSQFFSAIKQQLFYQVSVGGYFGFVLISTDISLKRLCDVEIQGFKGYEKVKKLSRQHKS